jgi:hypothetical protein
LRWSLAHAGLTVLPNVSIDISDFSKSLIPDLMEFIYEPLLRGQVVVIRIFPSLRQSSVIPDVAVTWKSICDESQFSAFLIEILATVEKIWKKIFYWK